MVMRVGGIASGMDIEGMVNKLMEAERIPLIKMQQQQTTLEWKRDAFRDVNSVLLELDNIVRDMKYSSSYKSKGATSSNEGAVTATANTSASDGSYRIDVTQLATSAMNVGNELGNETSLDTVIGGATEETHIFETFNTDGTTNEYELKVGPEDTLKDVLKKIETASEGTVRAFFDGSKNRVVMEATRTGKYNNEENGPEISFTSGEGSFFTDKLGLNVANEKGGTNAVFTYNDGLELESKDNNYTLNGVTFNFHSTGESRVTVDTDVDSAFDNIVKFVDKYNEAIELMNTSQMEEKFRDFPPLTEEQKKDMSEKQIEQWEEKAKSGILRGESSLRDGMLSLRQGLQSVVETGGEYKMLSQIGISTTENYMDGGKLVIDEDKLKTALRDNSDDVYKLFANSNDGNNRGLINRFDDALDRTRGKIEAQAGKSTQTLDNYQIGKRMKDLNERIADFERRMVRVESRYWNQFTQMEKAISRLDNQSSQLFSQFGGM